MNESAGRSGVVTTDSSTGESPNYGNTGSAEGFAGEFSEDVISHQFGVTFDQPKQSTKVYSDDLDNEEPFRYLTDWYIIKKVKTRRILAPLPDGFSQAHSLHGTLEPVKGLTNHPPIKVVIQNIRGWSIDRSEETRGVWIETSKAWYKLLSPSTSFQQDGSTTTMHDIHTPFRAKFQLLSNLIDMLSEDDFHYLDFHLSKRPTQVFQALCPTSQLLSKYPDLNPIPFDIRLLRRNPAFIKHHLTKLHPDLTSSCEFMKGLTQMEEEFGNAKKIKARWVMEPFDHMQSALDAENRGSREPYGDFKRGRILPRPNKLIALLGKDVLQAKIVATSTLENTPPIVCDRTSIKRPPPSPPSSSQNLKKRILSRKESGDDEWEDPDSPSAARSISRTAERKIKRTVTPKVRSVTLGRMKRRQSDDSDAESSAQDQQSPQKSVPKKIQLQHQKVPQKPATIDPSTSASSSSAEMILETSSNKTKTNVLRSNVDMPTREFKLQGFATKPLDIIFNSNIKPDEKVIKWAQSEQLKNYFDPEMGCIIVEKAADFVANIVHAKQLSSMAVAYVSIQALKKSTASVHKQLFPCKIPERAGARVVFIRWFNESLRLMEEAADQESMGSEIVIATLELMKEIKSVDCSRKLQTMADKFEVDWIFCVEQAMAVATKCQMQKVQTACYVVGAYLRLLPPGTKKEAKVSSPSLGRDLCAAQGLPKSNAQLPHNEVSEIAVPKRSDSVKDSNPPLRPAAAKQQETEIKAKKQQQTRLASMLKQARVQSLGHMTLTAESPIRIEKKDQEEFSIGPWDTGFESNSKFADEGAPSASSGWMSPCKSKFADNVGEGINASTSGGWGSKGKLDDQKSIGSKSCGISWGASSGWSNSGTTSAETKTASNWGQSNCGEPACEEKESGSKSSSWGSSGGWSNVVQASSEKTGIWGQTGRGKNDGTAKNTTLFGNSESEVHGQEIRREDAERNAVRERNREELRRDCENSFRKAAGGVGVTADTTNLKATLAKEITPSSSGGGWGSSSGWNNNASIAIAAGGGSWGRPSSSSWGQLSTKSILKSNASEFVLLRSSECNDNTSLEKAARGHPSKGDINVAALKNTATGGMSIPTGSYSSGSNNGESTKVSKSIDSQEAAAVEATNTVCSPTSVAKITGSSWSLGGNVESGNAANSNDTVEKPGRGTCSWGGLSNKQNQQKSSVSVDEQKKNLLKCTNGAWGPSSSWGNSAAAKLESSTGRRGWVSVVNSAQAINAPTVSNNFVDTKNKNEPAGDNDFAKPNTAPLVTTNGVWGSSSGWNQNAAGSVKVSWGQGSQDSSTTSQSRTASDDANPLPFRDLGDRGSISEISKVSINNNVQKSGTLSDHFDEADVAGIAKSKSEELADLEEGEIPEENIVQSSTHLSNISSEQLGVSPVAGLPKNDRSACTNGRGRGVDNRPAWMLKRNDSAPSAMEEMSTARSTPVIHKGSENGFTQPRGRGTGRGICNLPAWKTHGVVESRPSAHEETPASLPGGFTPTSTFLGVEPHVGRKISREDAERIAEREKIREEFQQDCKRYKVPLAPRAESVPLVTRTETERDTDRGGFRRERRYETEEDERGNLRFESNRGVAGEEMQNRDYKYGRGYSLLLQFLSLFFLLQSLRLLLL